MMHRHVKYQPVSFPFMLKSYIAVVLVLVIVTWIAPFIWFVVLCPSVSSESQNQSDVEPFDELSDSASQAPESPTHLSLEHQQNDSQTIAINNVISVDDQAAIENFIKDDFQTSLTCESSISQVIRCVLTTYRNKSACKLVKSGYFDLLGHMWMCIIQHHEWIDVCRVQTDVSSKGCKVTRLRMRYEQWSEQAQQNTE